MQLGHVTLMLELYIVKTDAKRGETYLIHMNIVVHRPKVMHMFDHTSHAKQQAAFPFHLTFALL